MPTIADYQAIIAPVPPPPPSNTDDPGFVLEIGGVASRTFPFNLEAGANFAFRSILMFVASSRDANNIRLLVRVNGDNQVIYSFQTPFDTRSVHELIDRNVLHANPNTVEFEIVGASGRVRISDPVIQYQRNI